MPWFVESAPLIGIISQESIYQTFESRQISINPGINLAQKRSETHSLLDFSLPPYLETWRPELYYISPICYVVNYIIHFEGRQKFWVIFIYLGGKKKFVNSLSGLETRSLINSPFDTFFPFFSIFFFFNLGNRFFRLSSTRIKTR